MFNMNQDSLKKLTKDELVEIYYGIPRSKRTATTERPELFDKDWLIKRIWEAQWTKDVVIEGVTCAKCYCDDAVEVRVTGPDGVLDLCEEHGDDFVVALKTLGVTADNVR